MQGSQVWTGPIQAGSRTQHAYEEPKGRMTHALAMRTPGAGFRRGSSCNICGRVIWGVYEFWSLLALVDQPEHRWAYSWWASLVIAFLGTGLQWWRVHDTFWAADDFIFLSIARSSRYNLTLLRKPLFEHFSPVVWTENKLETSLFSLNHGVALALGLTITAIGVVCLHRLLLSLTKSPFWSACLTGTYGLSLIVTSVLRWWITSIHANLAATLAIACLLAFTRYHEWRRVRDAILTLLLLSLALLTHEKSLLLPLYLTLLDLLVFQRSWLPGRLWNALRRDQWFWASVAALWAASLANYLLNYYQPTRRPTLSVLLGYAYRSVVTTFLPVTFGIRLPGSGYPGALASVGGLVQVLTVLALLAAVVLSCRKTRAAARGWLFLAVAFAANLWVLGSAVLVLFPSGAYRSLQWQLELAYVFPIGLAVVIREILDAPSVRVHERVAIPRAQPGRWPAVLAVMAVLLPYGAVSARSNGFVRSEFAGGDLSRPYLRALLTGVHRVGARGPEPVLLDGPLPGAFAPDWMFPYNMVRELVVTFRVPARINVHAASEAVYEVSDAGSIEPYTLGSTVGVEVQRPQNQAGGSAQCATARPEATEFIGAPAVSSTASTATILRVDYSATRSAMLDVSALPVPKELSFGQLALPAGHHEYDIKLRAPPMGGRVTISISGDNGGTVCIQNAVLGVPVPARGDF